MSVNASHEQELKNPWQDQAALPHPNRDSVAFAFAAVAVCSLALALSSFEYVTLGILALLFFYVVRTARRPSAVAGVLVTAVLFSMIDHWIGAAILCLIVGTCAAAFLFTVITRPYLVLLPFLAAFGIALVIVQDWRVAILTLAFLPASLLLAVATQRDEGRTSTICWTIGGLVLFFGGVLIYWLWAEGLSHGIGIYEHINLLRESFTDLLYSFREYFFASLKEAPTEDVAATVQELEQLLNRAYFEDLAASVFNLIPAGIVILCSIVAFNAQLLLNAQYHTAGMERVVTPSARIFTMSWLSAVLYIISFVITMFAQENSMFLTVATNLCLILLPGLCVRAVTGIAFGLYRMQGKGKSFFVLLLAVMLCCNFFAAFYFLAFWGAYQSIMESIQRGLLEKMKEQDGGQYPPDGDDN